MLYHLVGVVLVSFGTLICVALLRRLAEPFVRRASFGYYLALLPAGIVTLYHPELFVLPIAVVAGLVLITLAARRTMQEKTKSDV